jgi:hypothetical protein
MRTIVCAITLLASGCGGVLCDSFKDQRCGEPYGPYCLTIDEYTASGYDTCADAAKCGVVNIGIPYPCNSGGPKIPNP